MKKIRVFWVVSIALVLLAGGSALAGDDAERATAAAPAEDANERALQEFLTPLTPAGKGGKKGPKCCDPALEPGAGGNPLCFEGHTCCSDGQWRCNNADGSPSCDAGEVCAAGCGSRGSSCDSGDDCCSGNCKGGRCK